MMNLLNANETQKIILDENEIDKYNKVRTIKFYMKKFCDPYGRVIFYDLKIKGMNQ